MVKDGHVCSHLSTRCYRLIELSTCGPEIADFGPRLPRDIASMPQWQRMGRNHLLHWR